MHYLALHMWREKSWAAEPSFGVLATRPAGSPLALLPAAVQGKGLGRFLMQLLELVGRKSGVARLMLTVFHQSAAAVALYRKLG